jgi:hypothetical protein
MLLTVNMEDDKVRSVIWTYFDRRKINKTIFGFCKIGNCSEKISCPTSSTTSLFTIYLSTSGNIVSIKRCSLLSEHVAELTFLHKNL